MTDRTREFIAATHGTTGRKGKLRLIEALVELLAASWNLDGPDSLITRWMLWEILEDGISAARIGRKEGDRLIDAAIGYVRQDGDLAPRIPPELAALVQTKAETLDAHLDSLWENANP